MTVRVWVVRLPGGGCGEVTGGAKESAWMNLYANRKAPVGLPDVHIAAYSEYAADHKAAQAWLKAQGFDIVEAKLKVEEVA